VSRSGLTFGVAVNWPRAIHDGGGDDIVVIDGGETSSLLMCCAWFGCVALYAEALVLVGAGLYQLTSFQRACLAQCESPLSFLMTRWRSGIVATFRRALKHAIGLTVVWRPDMLARL
jgi:hypothetical protein